jgi:hypothetical protein
MQSFYSTMYKKSHHKLAFNSTFDKSIHGQVLKFEELFKDSNYGLSKYFQDILKYEIK